VSAHEVDLGDVTNCGSPEQCETCKALWGLELVVLDTALGVFCAVQCARCIASGIDPEITDNLTAARRVAAHCEHLGITQRRMYEILDEEQHDPERLVRS
jgi:hypothetical protein